MKLTVDGQANDAPANRDIERAVEATPHAAGWRIQLKSDGEDLIEAVADGDGGYRVSYVDDGERFNSDGAVTADLLKGFLVGYLNGDAGWAEACDFVPDKPEIAGAKAHARAMSEPPQWAVILIAGAFMGTPLLFLLPLPSGVGIVWLVAGPMVVMGFAMIANKMMLARRTAVWPQAAGRISKSEVAARHRRTSSAATEVINEPDIEYQFAAKGKSFTGTRISIGEDSGGANTEATLAHYPVGATVMVYYDPSDPANCVLERDFPATVPLGCAALLAILAAVGFGGYWLVVHFWSAVAPYAENGYGGVVIFATVAGFIALMLFEGSRAEAQAGRDWATTQGKVIESGTESYRARVNKNAVTSYAPVVEYSYSVNGHDYRSRQIKLDEDSGGDSQADAAKAAARYPKDRDVEVHYDPANPSHAALETPAGIAWYLLAVAGACFAVAVYASGIIRTL